MSWLARLISGRAIAVIARWADPYHPLFALPGIDVHDQARAELGRLIRPMALISSMLRVKPKLIAAVAEYVRRVSHDPWQVAFALDIRNRYLAMVSPAGLLDYHIAAWALLGGDTHINFVVAAAETQEVARWAVTAISGPAWDAAVRASRARQGIPPPPPLVPATPGRDTPLSDRN